MGKMVSGFLKEEIKEAAGPLQVCAGHNERVEAAIPALKSGMLRPPLRCC